MTWQLRYQTTIMLKVDSVKNDGMFWVLSKIRKTILELYFRKMIYFWKITRAIFRSIKLKTQEKLFLSSLKLNNIYLQAEVLFL